MAGGKSMKYVLGALIGLVWGFLVAFLNSRITKRSIKNGNTAALMAANIGRTVIDIAALAVVFLFREYLPSFEATITAAAIAMSVTTIVFAYRISRTR